MKKIILNIFILFLLIAISGIISCSSFIFTDGDSITVDENLPCKIDCPKDQRRGLMCNDGSIHNGNGEGQCKNRGGVKCWFCKE